MIKVSVMYPLEANEAFDHDYYRDNHMPLVQKLLGDACEYYTVERGLAGGDAGSPPTYIAMCHIFSPSVEVFQPAIAKHGERIFGDIPNYTNIKPVVQVSEVVVGYPRQH